MTIREGPVADLDAYARISIAFEVRAAYEVVGAPGQWRLVERAVASPYIKDYDAIPGGSPLEWRARFDLSRWSMLTAYLDGARVGGAVVAFDTAGVEMLRGRSDLAVLWDIRVDPGVRRRGTGLALFQAAEAAAGARGCEALEVETQNINVAACKLYARCGCVLERVEPRAYPTLPDEVRLVWSKRLASRGDPGPLHDDQVSSARPS